MIYLITQSNKFTVEQNKTVATADPQPGKDKAILTLANGRKIVLDSTAPASVEDGKITIETALSFIQSKHQICLQKICSP